MAIISILSCSPPAIRFLFDPYFRSTVSYFVESNSTLCMISTFSSRFVMMIMISTYMSFLRDEIIPISNDLFLKIIYFDFRRHLRNRIWDSFERASKMG